MRKYLNDLLKKNLDCVKGLECAEQLRPGKIEHGSLATQRVRMASPLLN